MMDFCNIPDIKKFTCPDDFVKAAFQIKEHQPGTLRQLRALADSIGIADVMRLRRDQLVPAIAERIGWEKFSEEIGNIGISRNRFYELGIDKASFDQMIESGEIRISGKCRYAQYNKSKYCYIYNAYDYFSLKNKILAENPEFEDTAEDEKKQAQMAFQDLIGRSGMDTKQFSEYFKIPIIIIRRWACGAKSCPAYLMELMEYKLRNEKIIE